MNNNLEESIYKNLKNSFTKKLLKASLLQIKYKDNPIRYNSFAVSFRELVRHIFYELAPNEEVKNCDWYVENDNVLNGITKAQRIEYAVRGGLSDDFVSDELVIDLRVLTKKILKSLETLNKYTHIEEEVFQVSESEGDKIVNKSMNALMDFFNAINDLKYDLINRYEKILFDIVEKTFYDETFNEIDILSTHYRIEGIVLDNIEIENINSSEIYIQISGTVEIEHQYGSDRDVRDGNGDILFNSYPFHILNKIDVLEPLEVFIDPNDIEIDTSDF